MHRRGLVLGIALAAVGWLLAVFVAGRQTQPAPPGAGAAPGVAAPTDLLAIGAIVPASGAHHQAIRAGLQLAAKTLSAEWKQAPAIDLKLRDPQGSAATAREQLAALREEGVTLLAELTGPELATACSVPIRKAEVLVVSGGNPGDVILARRLGMGYFGVAPLEGPEARELTELGRRLQVRSVCVVYGPAQRKRAGAFRLAWGAIASEHMIQLERAEQVPWATQRIAGSKAEAVVLLLEPALAGAVVRGSPTIKRWLGAGELGAPTFTTAAGKADLTRVVFVVPEQEREEALEAARRRALSAWHTEHGDDPPPPAALAAYDALMLLGRAAKAARGQDKAIDMQAVLRSLRTARHAGATGRIRFDPSGARAAPAHQARTFTAEGVQVPHQGTK